MKVIVTDRAHRDISDILAYLAEHYPALTGVFEHRIRETLTRIGEWPESGPLVLQRPQVRVATLGRYPYRVFYRVRPDAVEILHIRHAARRPWTGPRSDEE